MSDPGRGTADTGGSPWSKYRVLDLADHTGAFCGKVLAEFGLDVIKLEPPGGEPGRRIAPFAGDVPHPERSLAFNAFNTGKRDVVLDFASLRGREILLKAVASADIVVQSFAPGVRDGLGLGYQDLRRVNNALIYASITPFGRDGPWAGYKITDLVAMALSGLCYQSGDADRPPVRISLPQAYQHAGLHAATGCMIALYHRQVTGEGQEVDVSIHQSAQWLGSPQRQRFQLAGESRTRGGKFYLRADLDARLVWPCKDGFVTFRQYTGGTLGRRTGALIAWMDSEGMAQDLAAIDWGRIDVMKQTQATVDHWEDVIIAFFRTKTRAELYREAVKRGLILFPVNTLADVYQEEQLASREFFVKLDHPELGNSIPFPGDLYKSPDGPSPKVRSRAPLLGEHTRSFLGHELGIPAHEIAMLEREGVIA